MCSELYAGYSARKAADMNRYLFSDAQVPDTFRCSIRRCSGSRPMSHNIAHNLLDFPQQKSVIGFP
jgi:hypothetical protein